MAPSGALAIAAGIWPGGRRIMAEAGPIGAEIRRLLAASSTATLCTQLFRRGLRRQLVQGCRLMTPAAGPLVGPAFTLRNIPAREDLDGPGMFAHDHPQRRAIEECPAGAVLVIDCRREAAAGALGDILVTRLAARGVAGVVTDGGMRDVAAMAALAIPVYAAAPAPPASFHAHHAVDLQVPIACGEVAVFPGDIMVGDRDGVVVIPAHLAAEVAADAAAQEALEGWILGEVQAGGAVPGLYPPDAANQARYEAWRKGRGLAGQGPGGS
jgi:regulator of RNase E activity RraA